MIRHMFLIAIGISFAVTQGCNGEKDSAPVKKVEEQIQRCKELLSNGDIDCDHEDFLNFRRWLSQCMTNVPSKSARLELANRYVAMMKDADLQLHDGNYRDFEMRVLRYEMLTGTIFNALKKAGVDNHTLMDFFSPAWRNIKKPAFLYLRLRGVSMKALGLFPAEKPQSAIFLRCTLSGCVHLGRG